jgi:hypothetical protein
MEHASGVGFCSLGEQAVAQLTFYASRCNATASAGVGCWLTPSSLRPVLQKETSHLLSGSRPNEFYFRFTVFVVSRRGADASHQWAACPHYQPGRIDRVALWPSQNHQVLKTPHTDMPALTRLRPPQPAPPDAFIIVLRNDNQEIDRR